MDEHARATTETLRQNEELNYHVRNLEDKNEELNLHVQDLEEKYKDLNIQVQDLENKNDELNLHVKNLEDQLATDRTQRAKEMKDLKKSMRDEFLIMFGNQQGAMQQVTPVTVPFSYILSTSKILDGDQTYSSYIPFSSILKSNLGSYILFAAWPTKDFREKFKQNQYQKYWFTRKYSRCPYHQFSSS